MLHCLLHTNHHLEPQDIENTLKDIIYRKFNNILKIEQQTNKYCWNIIFDNTHKFPVALKNNDLTLDRPNDKWSYWAQLIVEDELAMIYEAQITDEEYPQQELKPEPEQHITYKKYLETIFAHHSPLWQKAIILIELEQLPDELKLL